MVNQVFTTKYLFSLAEKWRISRLEILEEEFEIEHQKTILLVCFPKDHKYPNVVYVGLASFELQRHNQVEFGKKNVCPCYLCVLNNGLA